MCTYLQYDVLNVETYYTTIQICHEIGAGKRSFRDDELSAAAARRNQANHANIIWVAERASTFWIFECAKRIHAFRAYESGCSLATARMLWLGSAWCDQFRFHQPRLRCEWPAKARRKRDLHSSYQDIGASTHQYTADTIPHGGRRAHMSNAMQSKNRQTKACCTLKTKQLTSTGEKDSEGHTDKNTTS